MAKIALVLLTGTEGGRGQSFSRPAFRPPASQSGAGGKAHPGRRRHRVAEAMGQPREPSTRALLED